MKKRRCPYITQKPTAKYQQKVTRVFQYIRNQNSDFCVALLQCYILLVQMYCRKGNGVRSYPLNMIIVSYIFSTTYLCLLRNPRRSYLSFLRSALHKSHEIVGSLIMYENVTLIIVPRREQNLCNKLITRV